MEFAPFGQDVIPPTAGKAAKYWWTYDTSELLCKQGIEVFNLLNFLPSTLTLHSLIPPKKLLFKVY